MLANSLFWYTSYMYDYHMLKIFIKIMNCLNKDPKLKLYCV